MTQAERTEPATAAYLARRGVSGQWRSFVRALVETLDEHLDQDGRAALMRAIGRRMAEAMPLPHCDTLKGLEGHMNDALGAAEWGYCQLAVDIERQCLLVTHAAAPAVGAGQDAEGGWVAAVLEGLYAGWLSQQPGASAELVPVIATYTAGEARLDYGRAA
ncbi:cellulose biosynthesis protein BcsD [Falsiroseomonas selenitidurans]|uniref:Cellulose synthase n=1 Tax=Falsiroseomonas selenitidurans TaxID=2716335 RepID=A0ABX1E608_9PROT|nr:cellulose biosynthesis protein BcsD [Falsiroseomonas selenitidurans]NKC30967.1 cellulose synthase [Falsiroseomonas selenitidurans]